MSISVRLMSLFEYSEGLGFKIIVGWLSLGYGIVELSRIWVLLCEIWAEGMDVLTFCCY